MPNKINQSYSNSKPGSGFELPEPPSKTNRNRSSGNTTVNSEKYAPSQSNNSLIRAGKSIMESDTSNYDSPVKV